jgi:hypothetical protein
MFIMCKRSRAVIVAACGVFGFCGLTRAADTTQPTSAPFSLATQPATAPTSAPTVDPDRRDQTPMPIDSPPFPMSDWTGPDPEVGFHDVWTPYALEQQIKGSPLGNFLSDMKIHPYGWIDVGANVSSSHKSNSPGTYDLIPNSIDLDQMVIRFERFVDSYQTDHIDWGVRITGIYGTDYRYTVGKGYFDGQLYKHNEEYGGDFVEMFGEIYVPNVFDGLLIKIGRFISPADIEAQLAPQNYLYTHSLMFSVDPYTYTGVNTHWKLNRNVTIELGVDFGNDMAPWVDSAKLNGLGMIRYTTDDGNDGIYGGVNAIGNGKFQNGHDDLQQAVCTWGHRFNSQYHMQMEVYYMWMYHALRGGDVIGGGNPLPFSSPGMGSPIKGKADEWGYTCYLEDKLGPNDYITLRPGFLDDMKGQRTSFRTFYTDVTLGWSHNLNNFMTIRPEIQWERSYQAPAFDNGLRKNQYTAACDLIIWF